MTWRIWILVGTAFGASLGDDALAQVFPSIDIRPPKIEFDPKRSIEGTVHGTMDTLKGGAEDVARGVTGVMGGAASTVVKPVVKEASQITRNTADEVDRAGKNVEKALHAIGHFIEDQAHSTGRSVSDAGQRVREGKLVDAAWHFVTDQIKAADDNTATALQKSDVLKFAAQTLASGAFPGGAAAFSAWYTYKLTGDPNLALQAGLITGLVSAGMAEVDKIKVVVDAPTTASAERLIEKDIIVDQLVKKSILAGAIGGFAVAAAGGDEEAVKEGFLAGGGMVLIQSGYESLTGHTLNPQPSEGDAYCMAANEPIPGGCTPDLSAYVRDEHGNLKRGSDGLPMIDIRKTETRRPHVGTWAKPGTSPLISSTENNWAMVGFSKYPGMNAMALMHDHLTVVFNLDTVSKVGSIVPSMVITYYGTDAPTMDAIQESVADQAETEKR